MKRIFLLAFGYALIASCTGSSSGGQQTAPADSSATSMSTPATPQPVEFADSKYTDMGKQQMAALSGGDIDKWLSMFADNAKYYWNGGDSLIGKADITKYWTDRRKNVIDSLTFSNDIWLPVKVNQPQQQIQAPGVWLLSWYQVRSKYKNGKTMSQWIHTDYHFDANDKVDIVIQYIDRAPIIAALGHK
jgi:hypothetical protein